MYTEIIVARVDSHYIVNPDVLFCIMTHLILIEFFSHVSCRLTNLIVHH